MDDSKKIKIEMEKAKLSFSMKDIFIPIFFFLVNAYNCIENMLTVYCPSWGKVLESIRESFVTQYYLNIIIGVLLCLSIIWPFSRRYLIYRKLYKLYSNTPEEINKDVNNFYIYTFNVFDAKDVSHANSEKSVVSRYLKFEDARTQETDTKT